MQLKLISFQSNIKKPINEFLKIIIGPSSSHTFGARRIGEFIRKSIAESPDITKGQLKLKFLSSMAMTGKGHNSDIAITAGLLGLSLEDTFSAIDIIKQKGFIINIDGKLINFDPTMDIVWDKKTVISSHPNSIIALFPNGKEQLFESLGGGVVRPDLMPAKYKNCPKELSFYNLSGFIKKANRFNGSIYDFLISRELAITGKSEKEILDELRLKLSYMFKGIDKGRMKQGDLLSQTTYRSHALFKYFLSQPNVYDYKNITYAAAIASTEHSATGGITISAPTAGGGGVLPGVLYGLHHLGVAKGKLAKSLLIAGTLGLIIEHNACISGAEAGCTFEIGAAASMSAGASVYARKNDSASPVNKYMLLEKIHQAAEMVLEHNWNLGCDCVGGKVVIPCIERNGEKAFGASGTADIVLAPNTRYSPRVDFDKLVKIAYLYGKRLPNGLRETGIDGVCNALKDN